MAKVLDKLLLFIFSIVVLLASFVLLIAAFGLIPLNDAQNFVHDVYNEINVAVPFIIVTAVVLLLAVRFLYLSARRGKSSVLRSISGRSSGIFASRSIRLRICP